MSRSLRNATSLLILLAGLSMWTLAPYGGCSCNNPVDSSAGPTPTFTPTHPAKIDSFDTGNTDPNLRVNAWHGNYEPSGDSFGFTSVNMSIQSPGASGPGNAFTLQGTYGVGGSPACGGTYPYPFAAVRIYLTGSGHSGYENVSTYGIPGNTGLRFWAMTTQATAAYKKIIVKALAYPLLAYTDANPSPPCSNSNAYHFHSTTVTLTNSWAQYTIPYASFAWGGSWGADPNYPTLGATFGGTTLNSLFMGSPIKTQIVAIQFEPNEYGQSTGYGSAKPYDFSLDDIEFY